MGGQWPVTVASALRVDQDTVNTQSTYSQHPVNIQSTPSQHPSLFLTFPLEFLSKPESSGHGGSLHQKSLINEKVLRRPPAGDIQDSNTFPDINCPC